MTDSFVHSEVKNHVGIVSLKRHPVNAIDIDCATQLADHVELLEQDTDVHALIVTGSGGFFSAGLDLKHVPNYDRAQQQTMIRELGRAVLAIYGSRKPTVAAVNGHAVAAGTLFTLCCDYRVGTDGKTQYGLTGARVGVPYPIAALEVIRAELGNTGSRTVLLSATTFDANEAKNLGILDEIVPSENILPRAMQVAADRIDMPAREYGELKRQLRATPLVRIRESLTNDPALDRWITNAERTSQKR